MFPDIRERLPHIAVTTAAGGNKRMTFGRPFIGHTQAPPRVVTSNPGPYALANPTGQVTTVTVVDAPAQTYVVTLEGVAFSVDVASGTLADAASAIAATLRTSEAGLLFRVTASGATVRLEPRELGASFTCTVSANLTVASQAAGGGAATDMLVFQTRPGGRAPVVSTILFPPSRFATSEPLTAVPAAAIARVINEQALYAYARVVAVGDGEGVQLETGGPLGSKTPNEIEVLPSSSPGLLTALGLEVGARDTSLNPARPVMNRYHASATLNVTLDVFAESPNERTELGDLLFANFIFFLEQKHFTLFGRGVFDEAYPDEHFQISIHQEVNDGGETDFPRGEDQKDRVHGARLVVPVTTTWYVDRPVLVPSGPAAGQSWTLESANVTADDSLPPKS